MKHMTIISKEAPAKAENLLAKAQWLANMGTGVTVATNIFKLFDSITSKEA